MLPLLPLIGTASAFMLGKEFDSLFDYKLTNIQENKESFIAEYLLPGFNKNEINIEISNNVLTVTGTHVEDKDKKNSKYLQKKYIKSSFSESYTLPENSSVDKITSKMNNGILYITIPKNNIKSKNINID